MTPAQAPALTFRPARHDDVPAVHALLVGAIDWMVARGIRQWFPGEWSEDDVHAWVDLADLHVTEWDGAVVAAVRIQERDDIFWPDAEPGPRYIHRLVSDRTLAGQGLGAATLRLAEARAASLGAPCVRLDTGAENARLCRFYVHSGYTLVGERAVSLPRRGATDGETVTWRGALFEKSLLTP